MKATGASDPLTPSPLPKGRGGVVVCSEFKFRSFTAPHRSFSLPYPLAGMATLSCKLAKASLREKDRMRGSFAADKCGHDGEAFFLSGPGRRGDRATGFSFAASQFASGFALAMTENGQDLERLVLGHRLINRIQIRAAANLTRATFLLAM
jgi:hypothetical protein